MNHPDSVSVHATALVETDDIGPGTRIWAFVHIGSDAHVGRDCNVCDYVVVQSEVHVGNRVTLKERATIGTGAHIEDDVFVGPGVWMPNDRSPRSPRMLGVPEVTARYGSQENWLAASRICRGASIGTGVIIMPGLTIRPYAMVGAGALVTKDVTSHRLVVGNPARAIGWVCVCGMRLQPSEEDSWKCECGRRFHLTDEGGLAIRE